MRRRECSYSPNSYPFTQAGSARLFFFPLLPGNFYYLSTRRKGDDGDGSGDIYQYLPTYLPAYSWIVAFAPNNIVHDERSSQPVKQNYIPRNYRVYFYLRRYHPYPCSSMAAKVLGASCERGRGGRGGADARKTQQRILHALLCNVCNVCRYVTVSVTVTVTATVTCYAGKL